MTRRIFAAASAALSLFALASTAQADGEVAASMPTGASTKAGWMKAGTSECIAGDAKKALTYCPAGPGLKKSTGRKTGAGFIETDSTDGGKAKKVDKPSSGDLLPPRPSPELSKKVETSLMTEIFALEKQLEKTKVTSDKHVTLARRLAESWYELERIKQGEALELFTKIVLTEKDKKDASALKTQRAKAEELRDKSQGRVTELYRMIVDKHDDYPKLDEVLYYLAYEFEQQKATDPTDKAQVKKENESKTKALATYLELIKKRPKSKFVSAAYIAYGDLYFEDALNGKIDWKIPLEAYERVVQSGDPPDNKQWGYAQYRKGFIYWNLGQYKDAVVAFKKAIEFGTKFSGLPKAPQLAEEARKELVPVYAEYGKSEDATTFFGSIAGDKPGEKTKTIALLEKLGDEYLARAKPLEAKKLFQELKGQNPGSACFYDTRITEAVISANPRDKGAIRNQLALLTKNYMSYKGGSAPEEKKVTCGNETAWLLAEYAIAWEYEALGDLGCPPDPERKIANPKAKPGTCNKETIKSSLEAFKLVLTNFKSFDGFSFKKVKKPEDAPTIPKMKYAFADLLFGQQMWAECGPAFDEVVAIDPTSDIAADAAYAAVLCYQNLYDTEYGAKDKKTDGIGKGSLETKDKKGDDSLKSKNTPKEMTVQQGKMVGAFDRFVCYVKPDAASKTYKDDLDKLIEIKYRRAFIYYEAAHWDEAAEAFREVSVSHPEHDYGMLSAQFYFDAIVRIYNYADPKRANCGQQMSDDVDKLSALYCDKDKVKDRLKDPKKTEELLNNSASLCDRLHAAKADLDAIKANDLAKAEKFDEAAEKFAQLAEDVCKAPAAAVEKKPVVAARPAPKGKPLAVEKEVNACEDRADIYLYQAALNYQRASKIKKAMDIREKKILGHDSWKSKETYRLTMFDLAQDYRRIALYSNAARWYETYAATDANVTKLLELAQGKIEDERKAHPEKYKDKKIEEVAKEFTEEARASALSNAVLLRLGLGQEEEAIRNSDLFDKRFGAKRKDQARQIFLAIGEHYVEKEEWKKGGDRLTKFVTNFPDARIDERLHAMALAGRANRALKQNAGAEKMFGEIRSDWSKNRAKRHTEIEEAAKANPNDSKLKQNAYSAVAEAYVYFADKDAEKALAVKYEPYKGNGDYADVEKWLGKSFVPYLTKRKELMEPAFRSYMKVLCLNEELSADKGCNREWKDIGEVFASKFVVEASAKAGDLYADTYDKALNAPLGNELKDQPSDTAELKKKKADVRATYLSQFNRAAEVIKSPARSAFQECLEVSTGAKFFDEYSERCESWLARVYKTEFRKLEEARPVGGLVGTGLKDRAFLVDSKLVPFDVSGRK